MTVAKGRPRSFDKSQVLDQITRAFWSSGYDGTSVADLTKLTGINPPSLYAAFGDKRSLFAEVLALYQQTYGAFTTRALQDEPTAYRAINRMLREAATAYTDSTHPRGCLVISAATSHTPQSAEAYATLRNLRNAGRQAIADKIAADKKAGALPPNTDPQALAHFYATVIQGMSHQARDGASKEALEHVADLAMTVWPGPK